MARTFERLVIHPDRGDGKPFIQSEWRNEFRQFQTREVADFVPPGILAGLVEAIKHIKGLCETEKF